MIATTLGDPASLSSLAAELGRSAQVLHERRTALGQVEQELSRWMGAAGDAFRTSLRAQLRALEETAQAMQASAVALQQYTVDLQHARALALDAEGYCHRHGLEISRDGAVHLPRGVYTVDEATELAHHVQEAQRLSRRAHEEAEDAAQRFARRIETPVRLLHLATRTAADALN